MKRKRKKIAWGIREPTKTSEQDSNSGPPEYEIKRFVLITIFRNITLFCGYYLAPGAGTAQWYCAGLGAR
jgi:hypothetical protein